MRERVNLYNVGSDNSFLVPAPKSTSNERKNRHIGLHQNEKLLCRAQLIRVKRQPIKWENISLSHISDKGLTSRRLKELLQCNNNKIIWLKIGQKTSTDISPKKIYKWPTSTWFAQQQMTTEKIDKFHPPKISLIKFNQNLN